MSDKAKILLGGLVSIIVGFITGTAGYLLRDSFDQPRIRVEKIQYKVTREQCKLSAGILYRFRNAHPLRQHIERAVPWSLARDLQDNELEYDHVEGLLRSLPDRREYLEKEIPFVQQQQGIVASFLEAPSPESQAAVKDAIAYLAGLKTDRDGSYEKLQELYAAFEGEPLRFGKVLLSELQGRGRALQQEVEMITPLYEELQVYHGRGRPKALPMVENDLGKLPNVQFAVNMSNLGRTEGQLSHAVTFESFGPDPYSINLIGQNPEFLSPTDPSMFTPIEAHKIDLLAFTIDRVRNQPVQVRSFYEALTSEDGIAGTFFLTDISGERYPYKVERLKPTN